MNAYNDKGEKHGPWEEYHSNGNIWHKTNFVNGNVYGLRESYDSNGKSYCKKYFI